MSNRELPITELSDTAERILANLGTPPHTARRVVSSLISANRVGHDSHGIVRLVEYTTFVEQGVLDVAAEPFIASGAGAVRVIDGANGWGQEASKFAVEVASGLAQDLGLGSVSIRNCNHIGRIGEYAEMFAEQGLCSIIWCNADPSVAPFGGTTRVLGTNPLAVGIPVAGSHPFVLDFATSTSAEGKLRIARAVGAALEPGTIIDSEGNASTDPEDFYTGGALLPFGGHKGYALSAFIELLGGSLSGNHPAPVSRYRGGNGVVMIALSPSAFAAIADFDEDISETVRHLRATPPTNPDRPVLVPGDIENRIREERHETIPVPEEVWEQIQLLLERTSKASR